MNNYSISNLIVSESKRTAAQVKELEKLNLFNPELTKKYKAQFEYKGDLNG